MAWQCHQGEQRPKAALDHRLPGELDRIINPEDESPTGEPPAGQPTIPTVPEVVELSRQFDTDANVDDRRMISSGDYAFDYDGSSNLTKVHGPGEALTFEFNAQRQLTGINGTHTYTYDLWGRRVSSSDSQTQEPLVFAWKDSRVIAIGQRSQGNVRWTHAIGYGPAGPVFMAGLQGNPSYLIATDHLSTPYGWVNAQTGKVYYTPYTAYSPWGEPLFHGTYKVPTPPDEEPTTKSRKTEGGGFNIATQQYVPQPYETADGPVTPFEPPPDPLFGIAPLGLAGHFLDRSTGLIYMHHRYFSPRLGHFLTPDFREPDLYDPTTVTEPYAYANGNPILFWDPNGLATVHWNMDTASLTVTYEIGDTTDSVFSEIQEYMQIMDRDYIFREFSQTNSALRMWIEAELRGRSPGDQIDLSGIALLNEYAYTKLPKYNSGLQAIIPDIIYESDQPERGNVGFVRLVLKHAQGEEVTMSELDLLEEIRKAPGIYLGEESLTRLDSFLQGYVHANFAHGKTRRDEWNSKFQSFIDKRYQNRLSISWCSVILRQEKNEVAAFRRFYQLLDEFKKGEHNYTEL